MNSSSHIGDMKTRKIKRVLAKGETTESVIDKIIAFMLTDKSRAVGLAEIHRSIDSNYTKTGINKILKKLEEDEIIVNTVEPPKDPRYLVNDIEGFTAKFEGYAYKDFTSFRINGCFVERTELTKIKKYDDKTRNDISEMIFKFGLISLQTILASYRRRNNEDNREVWLRNALSYENNLNSAKFSEQVKMALLKDIMAKEGQDDSIEVIPRMNRPKKDDYQKVAGDMELELTKMFPKFAKEFREVEDELWQKETYNRMKEVCKKNPDYLLK